MAEIAQNQRTLNSRLQAGQPDSQPSVAAITTGGGFRRRIVNHVRLRIACQPLFMARMVEVVLFDCEKRSLGAARHREQLG
jgi:hypothetical protein